MHIWFIMDGNRRWATARNMAKHLGHHQGALVAETMVEVCSKKGIEIMSIWALAKKNILERSPEELGFLYKLFAEWIIKIRGKCMDNNVRFVCVGDQNLLPESLRDSLNNLTEITAKNTGTILIFGIGYGGQDEIVRAAKAAIIAGMDPESLNEVSFLKFMDTGAYPPPDLIIRTGGNMRHSGFFLYQAEYSEYYFTKTLWPDFTEEEFNRALETLEGAQRNFGK